MPISSFRVSFYTKAKSSLKSAFWNSVDADDVQVVIQVACPGNNQSKIPFVHFHKVARQQVVPLVYISIFNIISF